MSTEENTGYISNSSERPTSCQRKKTLVTYRIHQRGPHHVNRRKYWLHIQFIREVHIMSTEENTGYISNSSERSTPCQRKKTLVTNRIHQRGPHHVNERKHWLHIEFIREVHIMSTEENTGYISNSSERSTPCQRKKTLVTYRIHQRGPHHVNGRKHWLHIEVIREVHIMSTEENTGYISNSSERSTSCQRKKKLVTYRIHKRGPHHVNGRKHWLHIEFIREVHIMSTKENTGYISNSSEMSTPCQRKKTLVTYRIHQRGPRHVNGRKHWLHIEFIREVHTMSTEENTGYISNSSERSTSCQLKKTLVTYRIHQRGPHHVNGRKHWLHIEFIREVRIMSTEENTGYISNSPERSTSCQRKKTLVTYRIHQRGPHHVNERKHWLHIEFIREVHIMSTDENTGYISNSSERSISCQRKKTLVTYRIHQRGPYHVNGRKHCLYIEFIREVRIMSTEENTGNISNSSERSTSCQRKKTLVTNRIHQRGPHHVNEKTLVTYRIHQRGPHHVNGRKHWLHIEFIREVHTMSTEENTGYISNSSERSTSCQRKKTLVTYRIHQRGPHHVSGRKHWLHIEFIREVHTMSTEENTGYISNSSERSTSCQRKKTLVTYRIHQRGPYHVNGRKHWLHIEFIREVHIMSTEENTGYISKSSERSTSCQRKKTLVTYRIHQRGPHHVNGRKHLLHIEFIREVHIMSTEETLVTYRIHQRGPHHVNRRKYWLHIEFIREVHTMSTEENTGYISNSSERSTSCQRKKTLVTYRIHQRGPHHVNGRKHWLHIEFIREVHIMSTEENTGYISKSSERSTSCQRKKTLVTYRIHQRGPHHVNGRKNWLHIEFIREVHIMSTEENTGYISNSSERSTSCQQKKILVTYRIHQRCPHHVNGRKHW